MAAGKDLFSAQAALYARFRPAYPPALFALLKELAPQRALAWDVATGNGQAAAQLATFFEKVVATDMSAAQISYAKNLPNVHFEATASIMTAEEVDRIVGPPGSVDLVTVAQALHWFDFETFYANVKRVLKKPGGVFAAWGYGLCSISPEVDAVMRDFYAGSQPFWEPQRQYVDDAYKTIPFDFVPLPGREDLGTGPFMFETTLEGTVDGFLGYLESWSAVQTAKERGVLLLDEVTVEKFRRSWGDAETRTIRWPVFLRIGSPGV